MNKQDRDKIVIESFEKSFILTIKSLFKAKGKDFSEKMLKKPEITIDEKDSIDIPIYFSYNEETIEIQEYEMNFFEKELYANMDKILPELSD